MQQDPETKSYGPTLLDVLTLVGVLGAYLLLGCLAQGVLAVIALRQGPEAAQRWREQHLPSG